MINKLKISKHNFNWADTKIKPSNTNQKKVLFKDKKVPKILIITTYPPRECGIATYSQDLIKSLNNKFKKSFDIKICALENGNHTYGNEVNYVLETGCKDSYKKLRKEINKDKSIAIVILQHEFGLFRGNEKELLQLLKKIKKSILIAFHTVLPEPKEEIQNYVQKMAQYSTGVIVMTQTSKTILEDHYLIANEKITVIPHGTHLVEHLDKEILKNKYHLNGRKVLSTFGLLSSGKSIETTLNAMPSIIKENPEVLFLIIGKTHPTVVKEEGEKYRDGLEEIITNLQIVDHVQFVNEYVSLSELLNYLQLTDIYLFTSKDPNQAVSGTFSYAISCGCPIISTPIPHAREVLKNGTGIIIDFENSVQLSENVNRLFKDDPLRHSISLNGLHVMAPTVWENSAIAHAKLFENSNKEKISLKFKTPEINLNHLKRMTTDFGIIQFSVINKPDINSGYTLDDNARALIAMCQHYKLTNDKNDLEFIALYFNFIEHCLQEESYFLNYVDGNKKFTEQNLDENLEDSNGRAIWALGYLISIGELLPFKMVNNAEELMQKTLINAPQIHSTRAMGFIIKGIYYSNLNRNSSNNILLIKQLADRLVKMYKHEANDEWQWFESYLTYGNSILPEAILCAFLTTKETRYKEIALRSFNFLISKIYRNGTIKVISNQGWLNNGEEINFKKNGGEQPIDVAYTIIALSKFYEVTKDADYKQKMKTAFSWFLGNNHLNKIIYNPCTGGCYDGLEDHYINLNQGSESTISYLMARLVMENHFGKNKKEITNKPLEIKKSISNHFKN
jgi:glycosyltransferase involved in cell wall biosynthesis